MARRQRGSGYRGHVRLRNQFREWIEALLGHKFTGLDLGELFAKVAHARRIDFHPLELTFQMGPWKATPLCLLAPCTYGFDVRADGRLTVHDWLWGLFKEMQFIVEWLDLPWLARASNAFTYYHVPDQSTLHWAAHLLARVEDLTRLTPPQKAAILEFVRIY